MMLLEKLSNKLNISKEYLALMGKESQIYNKHYRTFFIFKSRRKPKRRVDAPKIILKHIQSNLSKVIEENITFPSYIHGFIKSKSFITNAKTHLNQAYILSVDLKDFFPSIQKDELKITLSNCFADNEEDLDILLNLVTYRNTLPQGSPASPMLANLSFLDIDQKIYDFCNNNNMKYTRYADDITISSNSENLKSALEFIQATLLTTPYDLNKAKTKISNTKSRQEVTGIVINPSNNSSRLKMNRKWRRNIRAGFYNAQKHPFRNRHNYSHLSGSLNLLTHLHKENGEDNAPDEALIKLGRKALRKLKPYLMVIKAERLLAGKKIN